MLKVDFGKDLMHTYIYMYISIIYNLVLGYMHNYVQVQVDLWSKRHKNVFNAKTFLHKP